jgi:membrane protease YdiL (CAAX protease family)
MSPIKSFLTHHAVATFCTLSILLSLACYLLPIPHGEAVEFVIVLVPTLVAIVLAALIEGGPGVRSLLGKLAQWRISFKWLAIALGIAFTMRLTISLIALLIGLISSIQLRSQTPAEVVLFVVILFVAAIPEELGWRGYALQRLLQNHSAVNASLVIGVLWGLVHLTLHLPGMPNEGLPGVLTVIQLIGLSILLSWFYIQGGCNIILTSIFHAAQSFFLVLNEGVTLSQQAWLMAVVFCATAAIVIASWSFSSRGVSDSASPEKG